MRKTRFELSQDASEFLFYSCYGKTWEQLKNEKDHGGNYEAIYCCFRRAYRDFNRTLNLKKEYDLPDAVFYSHPNNEETVGRKINRILTISDSKSFNNFHDEICGDIIHYAEDTKCLNSNFYYGQAQKWLNMTLKYMYMAGIWKDEFDKVKEFLHVPLDSYILRAVFNAKTRVSVNNEVENLINEDNNWAYCDGSLKPKAVNFVGKYDRDNNGNIKPIRWSRINNHDDYKKIQDEIKNCMLTKGIYSKCDPLKWENKVWMIMVDLQRRKALSTDD